MSNGNQLFIEIVENLLQGNVICSYSNRDAFDYLEDEISFEHVDRHLKVIGRRVKRTTDNSGFYSGYQDITDQPVRNSLKRIMSEAINDIEPMVRLLKIYGSASSSAKQIVAGEVILESVLLASIEDATPLIDDLNKLSNTVLFGNNNKEPSKQLNSVLKKLCDNGYLIHENSRYIATGKWSLFADIIEFIATHEQLDIEEDTAQQLRL